jgi:hypothetical protein
MSRKKSGFSGTSKIPTSRRSRLSAQRSLATVREALRHFRPRKSERGSWVWITAKAGRNQPAGQRMALNDRRKGFAVYVAKSKHVKHRVRVYREPIVKEIIRQGQAVKVRRGTQLPTPRKQTAVDLTKSGTKYQKKAAEKYYAQLPTSKISYSTRFPFKPAGYDFNKEIAPAFAKKLQQAANRFSSKRTFIVKTICVVQGLERGIKGKIFETNEIVNVFNQADAQKQMALGFYQPFVQGKLYAALAEQLQGKFHFVTEGSKRAVAALPWNQGKGEKRWRDKRGEKWQKIGLPTVRIVAFQSKIEYHQIKRKPSGKRFQAGDVEQPF